MATLFIAGFAASMLLNAVLIFCLALLGFTGGCDDR